MPTISSNYDGASLFYRQYVPQTSPPSFRAKSSEGKAKPTLVFSSGWPFDSHMYDHFISTLTETHRFPCLLPDRRGFGRSEWSGPAAFENDAIGYETLGADLHQVVDACPGTSRPGFVAIGTSMGCGEIIEMLLNDKTGRLAATCKGIVFICSALPIPMWTEAKPVGPQRTFWDELLDGIRENPDERLAATLPVVFGSSFETMTPHEIARYERIQADADRVAVERIVQIYLNRDFTEKLKTFGSQSKIPVLMLHGSEDHVNPADVSPRLVESLLPGTEVKIYEGAGHALYQSHKKQCLADLLEFLDKLD